MRKIDDLINKLCPDGVEYKKLGELITIEKGKQLNKTLLSNDGEYPVINGGIMPSGYWNEYNYTENLITISQGGASAGYVNFIDTKFWAGAHCYVVAKVNNEINYRYVFHFLKSKEVELQNSQIGAGIPSVSLKDINNLCIAVPPMEVQCEIVHILDDFTLLSAELSAELKAREKQYNYYKDKLFLDLIDSKKYKLNEIAEIYDGTHQTPKYTDSGVSFISVENINDIYNSKKYISKEDFDKYKIKPRINDVFMTRIGTVGKCSVYDKEKDLAYYVSLALIRPNTEIVNSYYLKYLIESIIGIKELRKRTLVNAVPIKVNKDDIGKIELPIPSIEEQEKIVQILTKFDKITNDISEGLPAEIEARQKQYEYYRDKLLTFKELVNEG